MLAYLQPDVGDLLLQWPICGKEDGGFDVAAFVTYDPLKENDAFSQIMGQNLVVH